MKVELPDWLERFLRDHVDPEPIQHGSDYNINLIKQNEDRDFNRYCFFGCLVLASTICAGGGICAAALHFLH